MGSTTSTAASSRRSRRRCAHTATSSTRSCSPHLAISNRPGPLHRCAPLTFAFRLQTSEIVELPCPDTTPASERRELRILTEDDKFDPEHYMYAALDGDTPRHTQQHTHARARMRTPWAGTETLGCALGPIL